MRQALSSAILAGLVVVCAFILYGHFESTATGHHPVRPGSAVHASARPTPARSPAKSPAKGPHADEAVTEAFRRAVVLAAGSAPLGCALEPKVAVALPGVAHPWICYTAGGRVEVGANTKKEVIARVLATPPVALPPGAVLQHPAAS